MSELYKTIVVFFARDFDVILLGSFFVFEFLHRGHSVSILSVAVKDRKHMFEMAISATVSIGISFLLKNIFAIARPYESAQNIAPLFEYIGNDFSFPSGHAMVFFALSTVLFIHNRRVGIVAYVGSALVAVTRVLSFVHFPIDVIIGALLGSIIGFLVHGILKNIVKKG